MLLLASRVTVERPLVQGRSSFIISGSRTYLDAVNWEIQKVRGSYYIQGYSFGIYLQVRSDLREFLCR